MFLQISFILSQLAVITTADWDCFSDSNCRNPFKPYCCRDHECCSIDDSDISDIVVTGGKIAVGVIIAIVVAIIIFIIACIVGCVLCCRRSQNNGYIARPQAQGATTVHTTHHVMQPQHGYHPGQIGQSAPPYGPPGQPIGPPPYPQSAYPPPQGGYPGMPQPTPNLGGVPYPAAPPDYSMQSHYPTKDGVQASAPPME